MATTEGADGPTQGSPGHSSPGQGSRQGRTQAERRAASERRLLNATARLIAERGTSSVSFADIAREAGCSHGLPGYLFGSKTNLLLALVDDFLQLFQKRAVQPALEAREGTPEGLELTLAIIEVFLDGLEEPWPHTRAIYVLIGESQGAPAELREALAGHHDAARRLIARSLQEGVAGGEIRPDIDIDAQAVALMGLLRGIGLQVLMDHKAIDVPAVTAEVLASTRKALAVG